MSDRRKFLKDLALIGAAATAAPALGCATAKAVLNTPREELIEKADLEEDTVDNVLAVLKAEFDE